MIDAEYLEGDRNPSMDPDLYRFGDEPGDPVRILVSRSDVTGSLFWPRRLRCPESGGTVHDAEIVGSGVLWTWTFVHAPWAGIDAPSSSPGYGAGLIDLDGVGDARGPRVIGVLLGDMGSWRVGDRLRAVPIGYRLAGEKICSLLAFEKVSS